MDGNTVLRMGTWTTGCWRYITDCTDGMTISLWLKVTSTPGGNNKAHGIISTLNLNMGNGFYLATWMYYGDLSLGFGIINPLDGAIENIAINANGIGSWHHYVLDTTINSDNLIFNAYTDGGTTSGSRNSFNYGISPTSTPRDVVVFGNMFADNPDSNMPSVMIDDVLMFNYTLVPDEVTILSGTI